MLLLLFFITFFKDPRIGILIFLLILRKNFIRFDQNEEKKHEIKC